MEVDRCRQCRDNERQIERLRPKLAAAEAENARLREALEAICFGMDGWYSDPDDDEHIQDVLMRLGILVEVPATEDFKREWDCDEMLAFSWSDAARVAAKERLKLGA